MSENTPLTPTNRPERAVRGGGGPDALQAPQTPETAAVAKRRPSLASALRGNGTLAVGLVLIGLHLLLAAAAPLIANSDPIISNPALALSGPTPENWLGTDQYGRDVLARTVYGGRYALQVAFLATTVTVAIGATLGILCAYLGGWFDLVVMRLIDAILSIPSILSLLVVVTVFGNGIPVIVLAITIVYSPAVTRVVRGAAMSVVPLDFITAARSRGESTPAVVFREILPNVPGVILVEYAMRASWVVLLISTLSFLGFGANPPTPDWGLMISEGRTAMTVVPWVVIAPIIALSTLVIGLNLAADGLSGRLGVDRVGKGA